MAWARLDFLTEEELLTAFRTYLHLLEDSGQRYTQQQLRNEIERLCGDVTRLVLVNDGLQRWLTEALALCRRHAAQQDLLQERIVDLNRDNETLRLDIAALQEQNQTLRPFDRTRDCPPRALA